MKLEIKKSVREFVELILKSGSLDNTFKTNARAIEGVRAHQKLQKSNEEIFKDYEKEVYLKTTIDVGNFILCIEGRCDGIIVDSEKVIVEEIKSTYAPLNLIFDDFNEMHWSQGKIYAYMIAEERSIEIVYVQLSYYNLDSNEVKTFLKKYTKTELNDYMMGLVFYYKEYVEMQIDNKLKRNLSIEHLEFPFKEYRKGQLSFIKSCYGTIRDEEKIFIQAPTGTGKTISTIFPSLKALNKGYGEKIFYLTAKGANKVVAEDTINILRSKGLSIKSITIQAKEKICLNNKMSCNKDECIYADSYYDKLKKSILDIVSEEDDFSIEKVIEFSKKYKICPFELSLDLIEWCDLIVCDYNYIFDPRVYLRRIVEEGRKNILLIDEAHNLVDRGRSSFSAVLSKNKFQDLKRDVRGIVPELYRSINRVTKLFEQERLYCEEENKKSSYYTELPKEFCNELKVLSKKIDKILSSKSNYMFSDKLLDLYFDINSFLGISELYNEDYYTYIKSINDEVQIALFCANPAKNLKCIIEKMRASILFSATLSPFEYFIKILGGGENDYRLKLQSPFPKENFNVYISKANTRYMVRKRTIPEIAKTIVEFLEKEEGNYIVFFPSYEYMKDIGLYLDEKYKMNNILCQESNMTTEQQEYFIEQFKKRNNIIGFCVMGGSFSEGIDLPGKELVGVVIVGVGYPKISIEGEIIKRHFKNDGENIAYIYPGINKVLQASGRVIRRETDKGRLLLIDDRYLEGRYFSLLPDEWKPIKIIK